MTLYGVDIHEQYQAGISIPTLKAQGYTFVVMKASEGLSIPSASGLASSAFKTRMVSWIDQTRAQGMVPGLYHWIKAGQGAAQAKFFFDLVKLGGGPHGMVIQLDCEDNASYQDVRDWDAAWKQLSAGHPYLLYTGKWWWGPRAWAGQSLTPYLWDSHYLTADADTIPDDPAAFAARIPSTWWAPGYGGWPSSTFLQFTSRGDAGSLGNNVDLNVFRGTLNDLVVLTGGDDMADDWGQYGPPKPIGDRTAPVLTADLFAQEMYGHSAYDGTSKSARTLQLERIEADLADIKAKLSAAGTAGTLDAESLATAMRAVIRDELNKTHLQG